MTAFLRLWPCENSQEENHKPTSCVDRHCIDSNLKKISKLLTTKKLEAKKTVSKVVPETEFLDNSGYTCSLGRFANSCLIVISIK